MMFFLPYNKIGGGVIIHNYKLLVSVEFFYIMFLFSGSFKESVNVPFDLTALFLILTAIYTSHFLIKNKRINKRLVTPIFFIVSILSIIFINMLAGDISNVSIDKISKFIFLTIPTYLLPLFFVKDKDSVEKIFKSISIVAIMLSVFSLPMILGGEGLFVGFNDGNYLGLARVTGAGFISLFYSFLKADKKYKFIVVPFLLLTSFTLLSTGSRMPLLALVLLVPYALLSLFTVKKKKLYLKKKFLAAISLVCIIGLFLPYLYSKGYIQTIIYRFQVLFEGEGGASIGARTHRIQLALEMFQDNLLLGGGFGHFGDYYNGTSGVYAHNVFLEFLSELGIIGFVWFFIFLAFVYYRSTFVYKRTNNGIDGVQITLIAMFLFFFFNAMVSGDINDNRAMFGMTAILMISPYLKGVKLQHTVKVKNRKEYKPVLKA